jgi:small subunit ribosomal protein S7
MPRKGPVAKRDVLPDPIYNSKLVTRLINKMMVDGKRGKSQAILYAAFDTIRERSGKEPMEVFDQALKIVTLFITQFPTRLRRSLNQY